MVREEEGARRRQDGVQSHPQPLQGRHQGKSQCDLFSLKRLGTEK